MPAKRIYQIAKELNISHIEIVKFLKSKEVSVANHMAPVDGDIYDMILIEFSKEKADIDRIRKEKARTESIKSKDDLINKTVEDTRAKQDEKSKVSEVEEILEIKDDSSDKEKKIKLEDSPKSKLK